MQVFASIVPVALLVAGIFIYTLPVYLFNLWRSKRLGELATKLNMKYERNYNFWSIFPITKRWKNWSKISASLIVKKNLISGVWKGENIEVYDLQETLIYNTLLPNWGVRRTVIAQNGQNIFSQIGYLRVSKIERKLGEVLGQNVAQT